MECVKIQFTEFGHPCLLDVEILKTQHIIDMVAGGFRFVIDGFLSKTFSLIWEIDQRI